MNVYVFLFQTWYVIHTSVMPPFGLQAMFDTSYWSARCDKSMVGPVLSLEIPYTLSMRFYKDMFQIS